MSNSRIPPSLRRNAWRSVRNVAAVLVTLELLTRFWSPDVKDGLQFDPDIGYRSTANVDKMVHSGESGLNFRFQTNSLGFRGEEWTAPKPENAKRVAVFGHSFTHGISYPHELTFCGLLEAQLKERDSSQRWDIMNCGISGSNTIAQLRAFEKLIKPQQPDLVICCFAVSTDIKSNSKRFAKPKWPSAELNAVGQLVFHASQNRTGHDLRNKSRFHVWQKKKVQSVVDRIRDPLRTRGILQDGQPAGTVPPEFPGLALTDRQPDEELGNAWIIAEEMLARFQNSVEQTGAEFLVISIPMAWQVYPDLYNRERSRVVDPSRYEWDYPRVKLKAMLERHSIESVDLVPSFREACPSRSIETEEQWLYLHGDGHFNARAHRLVAEETAGYLLQKFRTSAPPHSAPARSPERVASGIPRRPALR